MDSDGIHATTEKLDATAKAPRPKNVNELMSFINTPLNNLLKHLSRVVSSLSHLSKLRMLYSECISQL